MGCFEGNDVVPTGPDATQGEEFLVAPLKQFLIYYRKVKRLPDGFDVLMLWSTVTYSLFGLLHLNLATKPLKINFPFYQCLCAFHSKLAQKVFVA